MHESGIPHLREALLFLALAGILIPLLQRFRISNVLGFLVVGLVVGPFGLGRFAADLPWLSWLSFSGGPGVAALAEIGVMFLMFSIGLELSTERLWAMRRWVFGAGTLQIVVTAVVVGLIAARFGHAADTALLIGLILAFSSTAVVMQLLSSRHELGTPTGRSVFSILLMQDLAVVPVLILVGTLGSPGGGGVTLSVAIALLKAAAAIAFIYLLGRRVIRPLFRWFAASRQADTFMALTLLSSLGIASLTFAAGLSMALGAFLAGLLLAETEFRHEVEVTIEPFRGLLMGLFFMSVGMGIDPAAILRSPGWLLAALVGLFALKSLVVAALARAFGLATGRSVEAGLLLGQGGEFAFIVIGAALASKLLDAQLAASLMLLIGLSLFVTPLFAALGRALGEQIERARTTPAAGEIELPRGLEGHVVIAGYGRVGQLMSGLLDAQGIAWVAIDDRPATAARFHSKGLPVFVGDAGRAELLRRLGMESARVVVLTMDQPAAALHALAALRQEWPALPVLARARDEVHAAELRRAGASVVVPETLESALQLGARVLDTAGLPEEAVARLVELERGRRQASWSAGGARREAD
ncbi:cation:proton antiporter domain-containing protein [Zeimonas arvi]|uniref:Potassium transporter n=1 Tax=Zeimonas arvi TaxID=2498847 RepID=A0A5C8NY75_9BURK|nr:cation:proton antiporter [Zeimonas arvi]TXL66278.1 potassium transporter [Zeimonas arvi]